MLAFVGFCVQQTAYPGTGPLENLATHLADPWHNNIGDIIIPRSLMPWMYHEWWSTITIPIVKNPSLYNLICITY